METAFKLKLANIGDWEFLLSIRNEITTRRNFFNSKKVTKSEHIEYLKEAIKNPERNIYIFFLNNVPIGTIREDKFEKDSYKLSYSICYKMRAQKLGQLMMNVYLFNRSGSFFCEVKRINIGSIKMIKKLGFKYYKNKGQINYYKLKKLKNRFLY